MEQIGERAETPVEGDHLLAGLLGAVGAEAVAAVLAELARGHVQGQEYVLPGAVAGALDRAQDEVQRLHIARERGCEAALVAHAGGQPLVLEQLAQGMEDLRPVRRASATSPPPVPSMNSWTSRPLSAWAPRSARS